MSFDEHEYKLKILLIKVDASALVALLGNFKVYLIDPVVTQLDHVITVLLCNLFEEFSQRWVNLLKLIFKV